MRGCGGCGVVSDVRLCAVYEGGRCTDAGSVRIRTKMNVD
jgi:hypothetical protein